MPSLAGGSVDVEVNFLLSGVVAASGPDGANEKSPPEAGLEPNENFGVSSFFSSFLSSSFFSPSILSSSARTSATILFTASEDFFSVAAGAVAAGAVVWGAGAEKEGGLAADVDGAAREPPLDLVTAGAGSGFHPAFFSAS